MHYYNLLLFTEIQLYSNIIILEAHSYIRINRVINQAIENAPIVFYYYFKKTRKPFTYLSTR